MTSNESNFLDKTRSIGCPAKQQINRSSSCTFYVGLVLGCQLEQVLFELVVRLEARLRRSAVHLNCECLALSEVRKSSRNKPSMRQVMPDSLEEQL